MIMPKAAVEKRGALLEAIRLEAIGAGASPVAGMLNTAVQEIEHGKTEMQKAEQARDQSIFEAALGKYLPGLLNEMEENTRTLKEKPEYIPTPDGYIEKKTAGRTETTVRVRLKD